ncbi:MAG: ribbon-helix-helix protein, CopG family, partial [Actinobacteria bacterium]|nr:ribbon-helix-helix protein, CopG family [Actinomycetota bacterium]
KYHMVMPRRQVLVQLDDELVLQLDQIALLRGTNRSELLRQGALAIISTESNRLADDALRASYRFTPQVPAIVDAARRLAAETMPAW